MEAERHDATDEGMEASNDIGRKKDGKGTSEEGEGGQGEGQQSCQAQLKRSDIKGR